MNTTEFNQWDYNPINLAPKEISQPLIVLGNFFTDDWLPDQLERLKTWRDFVLKDDYYTDEKNSPAGLLQFYKLNICLIEAMCLIEVQETTLGNIRIINSEQVTLEQDTWRDYPNNLTQAELFNPLLVVDVFFKEYSLPQYREQLHQWLTYGLSAKAAREFVDTIDLVKVYENLQKLYSAAWLIHQRTTATPYLKVMRPMTNDTNINEGVIISFYQLNTVIPPTEQGNISKIVSIIKHKVPTTQCVIYLGTIPDNTDRMFLLALTSRDETATAQSLNCLIEDSCRDIGKVTAMVHYTTAMLTALDNNSRFFHHAIHCQVIYLSGDLILPTPKPLERIAAKESEIFKWESWLSQGKDFLAGADFYLRQESANSALFSLHQCAECILIALIRGVNGYGTTNHNLSRLIYITEMFTADVANVFQLTDTNSADLFENLKQAYFNVRYKDGYMADIGIAKALYGTVKQLIAVAEKVYARHLLTEEL